MTALHLSHGNLLYLLWLVPGLLAVIFTGEWFRRRGLRRFSETPSHPSDPNRRRRWAMALLALAAATCIVFAAAGVGIDPHMTKVEQHGREVPFLVDVSRSMLARDLAPNRLARAKSAILDAMPHFEGDRVALVAFAGSASVICPLTHDYSFFADSVRRLSTASASVGGSMIGDAIRYVLRRVYPADDRSSRDIILVSDGGDQGSFPVRAASEAGARGIRILAIGLGNETTGTRIPVRGSGKSVHFLTYRGREVWSKLNSALLRRIAEATPDGRYLDVATGTFNLGSIYHAFVSEAASSSMGTREITRYTQLFQYFLLVALLLLTAELLMSKRMGRRAQ